MTPKEKAKDLVDKFKDIKDAYYIDELAKERALIAVNEILDSNMIHLHLHQMDYWQEVKQEIVKYDRSRM